MAAGRPNILWIVTTQWRAQACGFMGDPNARTPQIDALAAQGCAFTEAVTPHPFGPFARAAMLTGVTSPENGVRDYFDPLPIGSETIAHRLQARGYRTAFIGKWHLGVRDPGAPLVGESHARTIVPAAARGGFDFWEGFESGFLLNDPWLHGSRLPEPVRVAGYQSDVLCERAAGWIAHAAAGRLGAGSRDGGAIAPWFMCLSLEPPHPPYDAPAAGCTPAASSSIVLPGNVPRGGEVEDKARAELAGYYAHVEATDRAIGRLLAQLDPGNTTIVFTSVHGDMHGAHGLFRKGWPHEESVRVPMIVRTPAHTTQARRPERSAALVSLLDLPAWTVAWAEGAEWPVRSLPVREISMPAVVALPDQCDRVWRGLRTATRKLVLNADGSPWLFFDLKEDPLERENLVGAPARAAEIERMRVGKGAAVFLPPKYSKKSET